MDVVANQTADGKLLGPRRATLVGHGSNASLTVRFEGEEKLSAVVPPKDVGTLTLMGDQVLMCLAARGPLYDRGMRLGIPIPGSDVIEVIVVGLNNYGFVLTEGDYVKFNLASGHSSSVRGTSWDAMYDMVTEAASIIRKVGK